MALPKSYTQTKTAKTQNASSNLIQNNLTTFFGTLSGVVVGVLASLAMIGPMVHSEVASAKNDLNRGLNASLASATTAGSGSCSNAATSGSGSANKSAVLASASTATPQAGGKGGDTPAAPGNTWVHSFVSGVYANNTSSISDTGADSKNSISTVNKNTTTVKNTNDISVQNNNAQTAKSGNATSDKNTNGGNAASGEAKNESDTNMSVNVTN